MVTFLTWSHRGRLCPANRPELFLWNIVLTVRSGEKNNQEVIQEKEEEIKKLEEEIETKKNEKEVVDTEENLDQTEIEVE